MYPDELPVIAFSEIFEFIGLGVGGGLVLFLLVFFLCWGVSALVNTFKGVSG